jgi:hypothetical protein
MLKQLKYIYNLKFLKYTPLFVYLKVLFEILISIKGILIFLIIKRQGKDKFCYSRDYFKLKSNLKKV